jgi:hypothetical protein
MADCSKSFTDLSPADAWQCFKNADDWSIIGGNMRRMWDGFTGTTIGEWLTFLTIPAISASYILPLMFVRVIFQTTLYKRERDAARTREERLRTFWGFYLIIAGVALFAMGPPESFGVWQGMWMVGVGTVILMLGTSYWCRLHDPEAA